MDNFKVNISYSSKLITDVICSLFQNYNKTSVHSSSVDEQVVNLDDDLYILEYPFSNQNRAKYNQIIEGSSERKPFLIVSPSYSSLEDAMKMVKQSERLMIIPYNNGISNFVQKINLNTSLKNLIDTQRSSFFKVSKKNILGMKELIYDIYLQFSSTKKTRVYNQADPVTKEVLERYLDKSLDDFYLKEDQYYNYLDEVIKDYSKRVDSFVFSGRVTHALNLKEKTSLVNMLADLNLKRSLLDKVSSSLDSGIGKIESSSAFFEMFKGMNKTNSFLSEHCLMLCYVTSAIALEMGVSDSYACEKLVLASLLHDISIEGEFDFSTYVQNNHKEPSTKNHPLESSKIAERISGLSPDVYTIIEQHHERIDGKGYPKGIDFKKISELSAIFIVAEDFIIRSFNRRLDNNFYFEVIKDFGLIYDKSSFRAAYTAICKVIRSSQSKSFR